MPGSGFGGGGSGGGGGSFGTLAGAPGDNTALATVLAGKVDASLVGVANGVAQLAADGKVVPSQVAGSRIFQGLWNASTNTPAIPAAAAGNTGHYYVVNVAGSTNINGITTWNLGDQIVSNGTVWQRIPDVNLVATVSGVAPSGGNITLTAANIGLGNVANLAPADLPISAAEQTALNGLDARLDVIEAINQSVVGQFLRGQAGFVMIGTFGTTAPGFTFAGSAGSSGVDYAGATASGGGNFDGTTVKGQIKRYRLTSAATANSITGRRSNSNSAMCTSMLGQGGYFAILFGAADPAVVANGRSFAGWIASSSDLVDADPSTRTSFFGVGNDAGDANYSVMHNDGSGVATEVPLGANFPQASGYCFAAFWSNDNGATLEYLVYNFVNAAVATGTLSSNLPGNSDALYWHNVRGNGATALAVAVDHGGYGSGKVMGGMGAGTIGGGGGGSVDLNVLNVWGKVQVIEPVNSITHASSTTTLDAREGGTFRLNLTGNGTITTSNETDGQDIWIECKQDGTGSRMPALASKFRFQGGVEPEWSLAPNAITVLSGKWNASLGQWLATKIAWG